MFIQKKTWQTFNTRGFFFFIFIFIRVEGTKWANMKERNHLEYFGVVRPALETVTDTEWHIPEVVLMQLILLIMSTGLLETCKELK